MNKLNRGDYIGIFGVVAAIASLAMAIAGIWVDERWGYTAALIFAVGVALMFFGAHLSVEYDKDRDRPK